MKKDVIYIDVEDDITAIIGKVKASKEKVVALVPPKRIGVLQSAVNLRLLARAAKQDGKHLALISNNHALVALAAAASIPVAKNLQSKPEVAEIPALEVDDEDIIDGAQLPIGDHAKLPPGKDDDQDAEMVAALATAPKPGDTPPRPKRATPKVPSFDSFRKKLFLGLGAGVLLVVFLVWALFFAPRATVVISAKTTGSSINQAVTMSTKTTTDFEKNTLLATVVEQEEQKSVEFTATGRKDVGTKAAGAVSFENNSYNAISIAAGTQLKTSGGLVFTLDDAVTVPGGSSGPCPICPGSLGEATGSVTASEPGSKYNAASGSLSGAPSGVSTSFDGPSSGGVSKMVTVVTRGDVAKAMEAFENDKDTDEIKKILQQKFDSDSLAIEESFTANYDGATPSPAVGAEASGGKAELRGKVKYQMHGVKRSEIGAFVDAYMADELKDTTDQRVYDNGAKEALFQEVSGPESSVRATLIATAQVGPKINDQEVKDLAKGKRYGEIQQSLEAIQGIDSVDVKFFPFWVGTVPHDDTRIIIEFKLNESG